MKKGCWSEPWRLQCLPVRAINKISRGDREGRASEAGEGTGRVLETSEDRPDRREGPNTAPEEGPWR